MKITSIKQQVKNQSRYSVFVDDKYSFSLSELGLINSGLAAGQEISPDELQKLKDTSKADKAYNQTLNLLARRPRSRWELEDYMKRKGYEKELSEEILSKLTGLGYVDDAAFAKAWIESRRLLKSTSKRRLRLELKQKHIPETVIDEALAADETDESEVLKELVEKKRRQPRYQDDQKLIQYLARQGFNYGEIKSALSDTD